MAKSDTFHCSVITPERAVLECEAKFVAFPAHDGEMGVLRNRAALVAKLGIGELRVETADTTHVLFIDGGFVQVLDNQLTILTAQARRPEELDAASAERALREAAATKASDDASITARDNALRRARAQLKLARQSAATR